MSAPYAYFKKQFVPLAEAKIGVMTHAFNYGTGCFEGIRGNWNERDEHIYLFRLSDHFARLARSCRILKIDEQDTLKRLGGRRERRRNTARESSACACTTWTMTSSCMSPPSGPTWT